MTFTDYMFLKLALFTIAAFVWGLYCGLTGRDMATGQPPGRAPPDSQAGPGQGSQEDGAGR